MFDAPAGWSRFIASTWSIMETNARAVETLKASSEVIAARTAVIGSAQRSPITADYVELGRMIPEKVDAFTQVGTIMVAAWWSAHLAWMRQMHDLGALATRNRPATLGELAALTHRSANFTLEAFEEGARVGRDSLAPLHRGATSNVKRLRRTKSSTR